MTLKEMRAAFLSKWTPVRRPPVGMQFAAELDALLSAAFAEGDVEITVSGRRRSRCDADGRLRKMIRNCPRPPKT